MLFSFVLPGSAGSTRPCAGRLFRRYVEPVEWLFQIPAVAISIASLALAWRTQKQSESRDAATLAIARRAQEVADRAEARAITAENRNRVRFQFDSAEDDKGFGRSTRIRVLHVGTATLSSAVVDKAELGGWESVFGGVSFDVEPGNRVRIDLRRNFAGKLPEHLRITWRIGVETGHQVVPLPIDVIESSTSSRHE